MTARIVAVTNQKGGSGKTTTSMNVAAALGLRGLRVLVVDADPQSSATRWYAMAPEAQPFPATVVNLAEARDKIGKTIKDHLENYDVIVIDCPPNLESPVTLSVMLLADLAIAPILPSAIDTWATEKLLGVVRMARAHNDALVVRAMLNQVRGTALAKAISADLADDPALELLPVHLSLRTAYGEAAALGIPVHFTEDRRAIDEVNALSNEVLRLLALSSPGPAYLPPLAPEKATSKKATSKKATSKKATPKKATSNKATSKKATPKKAPPKKATSKKATSKKAS
jgi:chromosome partitioning protein